MMGAGWLENSFAEKDLKVLSSKLDILYFLRAGKRPISYWAALAEAYSATQGNCSKGNSI